MAPIAVGPAGFGGGGGDLSIASCENEAATRSLSANRCDNALLSSSIGHQLLDRGIVRVELLLDLVNVQGRLVRRRPGFAEIDARSGREVFGLMAELRVRPLAGWYCSAKP